MVEITDEEFEKIVKDAMDGIPERYASKMSNIGFVVEDEPTPEQRLKMRLHPGETLFGLYEGIPLTRRNNNYSGVLPDKITIFKQPLLFFAHDLNDLKERVRNTVWHEVAHYFGLDHTRIYELEDKG